jgi:quercetin dioxygenase-like cupin family protein
MKINRGREPEDAPSSQRGPTFTGSVWADPVLRTDEGVIVNTVFFPPGARTHWHRHERGQVLLVTHGRGFARVRDGDGAWIGPGDVVYFSAGEEHWHGAGPESYLTHTAISLGTTDWLDEVAARAYDDSVKRASLPQT